MAVLTFYTVGKDHLDDIALCLRPSCVTEIGIAMLCLPAAGTNIAVGVKMDIIPMWKLVTKLATVVISCLSSVSRA